MKKQFFIFPLFFIFLARLVSAHCPLCTIGAAAVAGGAVWLGISKIVVALFIGAFSMSMGIWIGNRINIWLKKDYIPHQRQLLVLVIFLLTLIPIIPFFSITSGYYLSLFGEYGTLFNRTYTYNSSLISSIFGSIIVLSAPKLSSKLSKMRNGKIFPFQGTLITLITLLIIGTLLQLII